MTGYHIGLQLYSVRDHVDRDLPGLLDTVAQMGYEGVEFAGLAGHRPAVIRDVLGRVGLTAVGAHVRLEDLDERRDETIADLLELGCGTAIVAWLPPELYADESTARGTMDRIVVAGAAVRQAGLRFAYHNHSFEFQPVEGTTVWSLLLGTSPQDVPLEIDVYWIRQAGLSPAELIRKLGSRVTLIHAKDTRALDAPGDCPVGTGVERWPDVLEACREAGVQWLVVEQERSADPLADVETSLINLRRLIA